MSRRGRSFVSLMNQMAREAERAQRRREMEQRRLVREQERLAREMLRTQRELEKAERELYLSERQAETDSLNLEINRALARFSSLLIEATKRSHQFSFKTLYKSEPFRDFVPPKLQPLPQLKRPVKDDFMKDCQQSILEKLFGIGKKSRLERIQRAEKAFAEAEKEFEKQVADSDRIRAENDKLLAEARAKYEAEKQEFEAQQKQHNDEVNNLQKAYQSGDQEAVEFYVEMVLERSELKEDFPHDYKLYYVPESKELVMEYELPEISVVPTVKEYKYVKTKDEIRGTEFRPKERNEIYAKLVAIITLRVLYEIFQSDKANVIHSIVLNGFVSTTDPTTGLPIRPCVITVQTVKETFMQFDLTRVDPIACVKGLKAHVSPALSELAPVKPIVDLNMLDKRFVSEKDMFSSLDDRTNLLEMNPFDFEHLICNLFSKLGLEAKLTRTSRDGGVDVVAFDPRPVFGGKYVIQAKRYKNTVDVSAVRDLYGTMMNENAAKGILVTTSTFGPDARNFAKDKPIELLDGANLLYLLEQQGIKAKIVIAD